MKYIKRSLEVYNNLAIPVKAGIWFTLTSFLQKGISFLTMPVFTRLLTSEEFGLVTVYNSWESIFIIFITLNVYYGAFNTAMIDFKEERDSYTSSLIGFMLVSTVFFTFILCLFKDQFVSFTGLKPFFIILLLIQVFFQGVVSLWLSRLKFSYDYVPVTVATLSLFLLSPLLSVIGILYFPEYKVEAKIIGHVLSYGIIGTLTVVLMLFKGRCFYKKEYWKYVFLFSAPLLVHYLASVILGQADRIMISRFVNDSATAYYSVAASIATILTILTSSANQAVVPWLYENIKNNSVIKTTKSIYILFALVSLALCIIMLLGPELISIVATQDYKNAKWAIPPIMASMFFTFIYEVFANFEFYFKKNQYIVFASIIAAVVNIVLNFIFIPLYGYIAAAYTTLICYILFGMFHYICSARICMKEQIKWPFKSLYLVFISLMLLFLMAGILYLYNYDHIRWLVFVILIIFTLLERNRIMISIKQLKH